MRPAKTPSVRLRYHQMSPDNKSRKAVNARVRDKAKSIDSGALPAQSDDCVESKSRHISQLYISTGPVLCARPVTYSTASINIQLDYQASNI